MIDHILLLVSDLEAYQTQFQEVTQVAPTYGGVHPSARASNALIDMGNGTYLELIGPALDGTEGPLTLTLRKLEEPRLSWFAMRSEDLQQDVERLESAGFEHSGIQEIEFESEIRNKIRYSAVVAINHDWGDQMPFFINWGDTPHPTTTSNGGLTLTSFTVYHPDAESLAQVYDQLDVDVVVEHAEQPGFRLEFNSLGGDVVYQSSTPSPVFSVPLEVNE